tara:strand:+ start:607 stop:807 length:201 start_codon:yes stop_codon:yes gene_type:complete
MPTIAKTESCNEHTWKVLDLDMLDLIKLADEGVIDLKLFDDLYYHLLDNLELRKLLKGETNANKKR